MSTSEVKSTSEILQQEKKLWCNYLSNRTTENRRRFDEFNNQRWIAFATP